MSLVKASPYYRETIAPKVGRGILGVNPLDKPLSTSIPFCSVRQLSFMTYAPEKLRQHYDLILGRDALQTCQATLDPDAKQLIFEESSSASNALSARSSNFASTDVLIDGNRFNFRFSFRYLSALVLSKSTYHFLSKNSPQSIQVVHDNWNGNARICRLQNITCGGSAFQSVWCVVQGNEDLIGMGLLTSFVIKLDFGSCKQELTPSTRLAQFADHSFSDGLDLFSNVIKGKQTLFIKEILENSIAFNSGFQKSDLLVKVGDFDLTDLNSQSLISALNLIATPRDKPLNCEIIRAGKQMKIALLSHNLTNSR